ncbi:hypothetical protein SADUNF_Sadunf04G0109000 [Salix dunnii]|uniref:Uncharacterized protein n=1 Tax=Salix dunnii TaxID=1413687 RepID=A0A835K9A7_9ROSI|nr:hypothetical protein SADUNF_Sadunf04G0109000 [Salix dunnii]
MNAIRKRFVTNLVEDEKPSVWLPKQKHNWIVKDGDSDKEPLTTTTGIAPEASRYLYAKPLSDKY